jgi:hypothetical protein
VLRILITACLLLNAPVGAVERLTLFAGESKVLDLAWWWATRRSWRPGPWTRPRSW